MASKCSRRCELSELVPHHVFRYIYGNEFHTVVYRYRMPDKIRRYRRSSRPGLNDLLRTRRIELLNPFHESFFYVRTFFNRSRHKFLLRPSRNYIFIRQCCFAGFAPFRQFAPGRDRMSSSGCFSFAASHRMINRVHRNTTHFRASA